MLFAQEKDGNEFVDAGDSSTVNLTDIEGALAAELLEKHPVPTDFPCRHSDSKFVQPVFHLFMT